VHGGWLRGEKAQKEGNEEGKVSIGRKPKKRKQQRRRTCSGYNGTGWNVKKRGTIREGKIRENLGLGKKAAAGQSFILK